MDSDNQAGECIKKAARRITKFTMFWLFTKWEFPKMTFLTCALVYALFLTFISNNNRIRTLKDAHKLELAKNAVSIRSILEVLVM